MLTIQEIKKLLEIVDGFKWSITERILFGEVVEEAAFFLKMPNGQSAKIGSMAFEKVAYPLLLSMACDQLGIYVASTEGEWSYNGAIAGGLYNTPTEAREAALRHYLEEKG